MNPAVYTDIHAHVLPGVDDGPADVAASLRLLEAFSGQQVGRIFCTSHYLSPHFTVDKQQLRDAYQALQDVRAMAVGVGAPGSDRAEAEPTSSSGSAAASGPAAPGAAETAAGESPTTRAQAASIELALGAEVRLTGDIVEDIRGQQVPTLGGTRYVLVEFPSHNIPEEALAWVYELRIRGYRPIMAHPERNLEVQRHPERVATLIEAGLLLQLTAACFVSPPQRRHRADDLAWDILRAGQASLIASDAHDAHLRAPLLADAYTAIRGELGDDVCDALIANANAVWMDEKCQTVPAVPAKRRFSLPWRR
ncbi:MAG: hypothetical protein K6T68_11785 [Alicyclobacillus shizuokensis]|nr:hypothetical protein [Alicyclobacillus shizuokensis]